MMVDPLSVLEKTIDLALEYGADAADAVYTERSSTTVDCRNGALEKADRSDTSSVSARVFLGQKSATVTSFEVSDAALRDLLESAMTIARHAPNDPSATLLPTESLAQDVHQDLDLCDPHQALPAQLFEAAKSLEESACSIDFIEQVHHARATANFARTAIKTTNGFSNVFSRTIFGLACGAIASSPLEKTLDHHSSTQTHLADLDAPEKVGRHAAKLAVAKLHGGVARSGAFPIVFSPRCAAGLLSVFSTAISGPAVAREMSFLKEKLGEQIFAPDVCIIDDPTLPRGLASRPFDGEGALCHRMNFVKDGVLSGWATNAATSRQLNVPLSGHGAPLGGGISFSNLYMDAGTVSPEALMSDIDYGLYITNYLGDGSDPISGYYSQAISGFLIERGTITTPVKKATIAGELLGMFRRMIPANDLELRDQINAPTVRIDYMQVAGA